MGGAIGGLGMRSVRFVLAGCRPRRALVTQSCDQWHPTRGFVVGVGAGGGEVAGEGEEVGGGFAGGLGELGADAVAAGGLVELGEVVLLDASEGADGVGAGVGEGEGRADAVEFLEGFEGGLVLRLADEVQELLGREVVAFEDAGEGDEVGAEELGEEVGDGGDGAVEGGRGVVHGGRMRGRGGKARGKRESDAIVRAQVVLGDQIVRLRGERR